MENFVTFWGQDSSFCPAVASQQCLSEYTMRFSNYLWPFLSGRQQFMVACMG